MPAFINLRSFHWILLIIEFDKGRVLVMDSKRKSFEEFRPLIAMIQR